MTLPNTAIGGLLGLVVTAVILIGFGAISIFDVIGVVLFALAFAGVMLAILWMPAMLWPVLMGAGVLAVLVAGTWWIIARDRIHDRAEQARPYVWRDDTSNADKAAVYADAFLTKINGGDVKLPPPGYLGWRTKDNPAELQKLRQYIEKPEAPPLDFSKFEMNKEWNYEWRGDESEEQAAAIIARMTERSSGRKR